MSLRNPRSEWLHMHICIYGEPYDSRTRGPQAQHWAMWFEDGDYEQWSTLIHVVLSGNTWELKLRPLADPRRSERYKGTIHLTDIKHIYLEELVRVASQQLPRPAQYVTPPDREWNCQDYLFDILAYMERTGMINYRREEYQHQKAALQRMRYGHYR